MDTRAGIPVPETTAVGNAGLIVPPRGKWVSVSPLNKRRWENFKANRRGYWSFWLFLILFIGSLFAEFITNDKPFLVKYDGHYYSPALFTYPETTFGGDFETATDYRDPFVQQKIADKGGYMIWPPVRYSYAGAVEADLDADRGRMQAGGRAQEAQ
jgi:microcin C transport system permease protein